jgi:hypothetical protein
MIGYLIPKEDLCAHLRNDPDPELDDAGNVCSASNYHLRVYHAMFMLDCGLQDAIDLYEYSGQPDLLNRPGRLETPMIVQEVLQLLAMKEACGGPKKEI